MQKVKQDNDKEAFNPRQRTLKQTPKKKKSKNFPQLPEELWALIISHISDYKILKSLLKTSSALQHITRDPASPAWNQSLRVCLRNSHGRRNNAYRYSNIPFYKERDMKILVELTRTSCSICKCKVGVSKKNMFWSFKKRLCHICVQECSIVDSALDYAFPGSVLHKTLPYEHLKVFKDMNEKLIHTRNSKHYLIEDLVEVYGDAITDGYVFEDFGGEGKKDYMSRKFTALDAMKVDAGSTTTTNVHDESESGEEDEEEENEEVYTGKVREKFLEA